MASGGCTSGAEPAVAEHSFAFAFRFACKQMIGHHIINYLLYAETTRYYSAGRRTERQKGWQAGTG
jgi:hypothetical protein